MVFPRCIGELQPGRATQDPDNENFKHQSNGTTQGIDVCENESFDDALEVDGVDLPVLRTYFYILSLG